MTTKQEQVTRRRFLGTTLTAAAGGILASRGIGKDAESPVTGSTDHFWYRGQPAGRFIDCQRGKKAFGYADGKVFLSEDNGKTWVQYDLKEFGRRSPCRINRPNSEGWFRMDLRSRWVTPAEAMFIKPKKA